MKRPLLPLVIVNVAAGIVLLVIDPRIVQATAWTWFILVVGASVWALHKDAP